MTIEDAIKKVPDGMFWSVGYMNVARHKPEGNYVGYAAFVWTSKLSVSKAYADSAVEALLQAAQEASDNSKGTDV